ncbi:THAP domain-containing protein 2-like [Myzus persicae]|uniref:THAP domain-containing protein 2-like n=1 Tax=Myzus persicae TaxID=13164 RepID=UPI000B9313B1|nr:THAP domain-containing protein 2-like [Myzus persicae]
MVNFCSGFDCPSSSNVREDLSFHKFPLKEKERLQKWVHVVRRKDFKSSSSSTLCSLHLKETDFYSAVVSGKQMSKKSAVPFVFNFPNYLIPKIKERRILQREDTTTTTAVHNTENIEENNISTCETDTKFVDIGIQTKLTGEELDRTLQDLH